MALAYTVIAGPNGLNDNIGGLTKRYWFAPISEFTTIEAVLDFKDAGGSDTADELVEIVADHTFAVGKGFITGYCTRDRGTFKATVVGDRDGRGSRMTAELFVPGTNELTLGQLRMIKNDSGIWLLEGADGIVYQAGSERFPCEATVEFDVAKNESGVRGTKIMLDWFESFVTIYSGTITEK